MKSLSGVLFIRVPYYTGGRKRDPNLENCPFVEGFYGDLIRSSGRLASSMAVCFINSFTSSLEFYILCGLVKDL